MRPPTAVTLTASETLRSKREVSRAQLVVLRERLRVALASRKARVRAFVEECQKERLAVRAAIKILREDALTALREEIKAAEDRARDERAARLQTLRKEAGSAVARARAAMELEHAHAAKRRAITDHHARRKAEIEQAHAERLSSTLPTGRKLEKVRPLLEKAADVKPLPGESRMEAVWRHAKAHPEEMLAVLEPKAEEALVKTKAQIAQVEGSLKAPNAFERKRAARVDRLHRRADKARQGAEQAFARERAIGSAIPMGQPILVGHHSEKRHRKDIQRIQTLAAKGVGLSKKASELARRATAAESNTAISSDDPDALPKLRQKLAALENARKKMRDANAVIRRHGAASVPLLVEMGFSEGRAKELLEKDFAGRVGFPDYALTNTSSEARRVEKRIQFLEAAAKAPPRLRETIGEASIDEADNRVRITFPNKPAENVRRALKSSGFRWTRSEGVWKRFASPAAWSEARRILTRALAASELGTPPPPLGSPSPVQP